MSPSDQARSNANKTAAAAAGKTNDKKPSGFGIGDMNSVQPGQGLVTAGDTHYKINNKQINKSVGGVSQPLRNNFSVMPNDQTADTAAKEYAHQEGMARLRAGLPYDANEAQAFQQQQQMGHLFDIATGNSQVVQHGAKTRELAANLLSGMTQSAAQRAHDQATLDETRRYHAAKLGVDAAKLMQPSVEKINSPYPVFDQFGNPVRNPKTNEVQMQNIHELMVNGVRQPSSQALGVLQQAATARAMNDPRTRRSASNGWGLLANPANPQDLVSEHLNTLDAQYGTGRRLVMDANGNPMWELPG